MTTEKTTAKKTTAKKTKAKAKKPEYQTRVIEEAKELKGKVEKLKAFLDGDGAKMPDSETSILQGQLEVMKSYLSILNTRIKRF